MLTEPSVSKHKYKVVTEGQSTKLISGVPINLNDYCYDKKRNQYVLSINFGLINNKSNEYVILNEDFQIVEVLQETIQGATPRLLVSPEGEPWVRLMSLASDYTKDIVFPLYDRKLVRDGKKMSIQEYRQELFWENTCVSFGYSRWQAYQHIGKPDDIIFWEFDKKGVFKKRTTVQVKFSRSGIIFVESNKMYVCNSVTENAETKIKITEINKKGIGMDQWISASVSGIQKIVPVSACKDEYIFIGLSEKNHLVQLTFSGDGKLVSESTILELPEVISIEEINPVNKTVSGMINISYESKYTNGFIQWNGKEIILKITSSGENNEHWTKVCGKEEFDLPYRVSVRVMQNEEDTSIMLSPFNYYTNEIGTIIIMK